MTTIDRANVDITATDKTAQAFKSAQQRVQKLATSLQGAGRAMAMGLTTPIAGIGVGALKMAGEFEAAMKRVEAKSGATGRLFDQLERKARDLGISTKFSATEAAGGIEMLVRNGVAVQDILGGALDATLSLSAATGTELAQAADIATDAMSLFNIKAGEMSTAVDGIVGVTNNSKFALEDYQYALATAGGVASNSGVEFAEFNAAITAIAPGFASGKTAGTAFKRVLQLLSPASAEAAETMERLGLKFFDAKGNFVGVAETAGQLKQALSGLTEEQANIDFTTMFGSEASNAAFGLAKAGAETINELAEAIGKVSAAQIAAKQQEGFEASLTQFKSAIEGLGIAVASSGLLDFATRVTASFTEWVRVLAEVDPEMLKMTTIVAGLAAAIGPLLLVLGGVTAAIGALVSPIGLVVVAITGLTAAWVAWGDEITAFVTDTHAAVVEWTAGLIESFMNLKDKAVGFVTDMVDGIRTALVDKLKSIGESVGDTIDSVTGFFADMWDAVVGHSFVPDMIDAIADEFGRLTGVMVNPARDATDSVTGFFDDMGTRVGSVIKGLLKGTTDLKSALRGLAEDYLERWIDRGIDSLFSDTSLGGNINGGGIGGGSGGGMGNMGSVAAIGKKVASWFGWGGGSTTSAVPGALGSVKGPAVLNYGTGAYGSSALGGQGAAAIGNGYGGGAVGGNVAAQGSAWGSAAGAAVVAAIAAYGFSRIGKKQQVRAERQAEFFTGVGTGTTENLGGSAWDFRGMLDDATAFFSTTREGWQSTVEALKEAGVAAQGWGASLDENGRGLVKIQGDIAGVKSALSGAVATGYDFVGSLSNAIEKGNNLRVSIQGDAEAIESALQAATAMGIGGFVGLEKTANGVSATLTGNIQLWDQYLQGFVNEAIGSAVNGVSALGGAAANATGDFIKLANAAARVKVGSSIGGGRSAQVDGSHSTGLPYVPRDGYVAELHRGERVLTAEQNRNLSRAGMDDTRMVKAIERQTQVIRRQGRRADYTLGGR